MSLTSFEKHVQPHLRLLRLGTIRIVPVAELQRYAAEHSEPPLANQNEWG